MTKTHWQVVSRTYPMPAEHTVTEFEFANGVSIHYDETEGRMSIHLPACESYLSTGRSDEVLHDEQFRLSVTRLQGVPVGIEITRSEDDLDLT